MRSIQKNEKTVYALSAATLAALILSLLLPQKFVYVACAAVISSVSAVGYRTVKGGGIQSIYWRQVLLILTVIALLYVTVYYMTGLYYGYGLARAATTLSQVFTELIPIVVAIVAGELLRSILLIPRRAGTYALAYAVGLLSDVLLAGGFSGVTTSVALTALVAGSLFPAVTSNVLFNYLTPRYGILPAIAYRLILKVYPYLTPIDSNISPAFAAFALIILPILTRAFIALLYEKRRKYALKKDNKALPAVLYSVLIVISLAFIALVSCQFRYGMIVVGSPSMTGEINTGDAVVYESYDANTAEVGDVIVFQSATSKVRTIHRIIEKSTQNQQYIYVTKGDANESPDAGYITDGDIIGTVRFKVAYIGYPSIWLRDIFKK